MTTTHPDPETLARLDAFIARCKQRPHSEKPLPAPPIDAPPPPRHFADTDKEIKP